MDVLVAMVAMTFCIKSSDKRYNEHDGKNDEDKSSISYSLHLQSLSHKQANGRPQRTEELASQHAVCLSGTSKNAGQSGQDIEK